LEGFLDAVHQGVALGYQIPGYVGGTGCDDQLAQVKWAIGVPIARSVGKSTFRRGGTDLTAGHPIVHVVGTYDGKVYVAPGGVDKMVSSNVRQVSIAADNHRYQFGVEHLGSCGKGNRPAVQSVKCVGIEVRAGYPAGAANAGYE